MKQMRVIPYLCAFGVLSANPVVGAAAAPPGGPVAHIQQIQGTVLVQQGGKYVPAKPGMPLQNGAKILVQRGGSAALSYSGGCVQPVGSGSIATVDPGSCTHPGVAAKGAGTAATGLGTTATALATVGVLGGIAGIVAGTTSSNNQIISPE